MEAKKEVVSNESKVRVKMTRKIAHNSLNNVKKKVVVGINSLRHYLQ